jgi:hypothetical protein
MTLSFSLLRSSLKAVGQTSRTSPFEERRRFARLCPGNEPQRGGTTWDNVYRRQRFRNAVIEF